MIVAAAFCPNPPVLVPAIARGAARELDDLRAACLAAVTQIAGPDRQLVVLGAGPREQQFPATARGSFAGFGVPLEVALGRDGAGAAHLPLALSVGAWLVHEALGPNSGAIGLGVTAGSAAVLDDGDVALLVMGDGSARRSTAAPGYLDDRAEGFDAAVVAALSSGDGKQLAGIDAELGAELLAAGVPAWQAAGRLLGTHHFAAELRYDAAPYGVGYFVAAWT